MNEHITNDSASFQERIDFYTKNPARFLEEFFRAELFPCQKKVRSLAALYNRRYIVLPVAAPSRADCYSLRKLVRYMELAMQGYDICFLHQGDDEGYR